MQSTVLQLFGLKKYDLLSCFNPPGSAPSEPNKMVSSVRSNEAEEEIKLEYIEIARLLREFFSAYLEQKESFTTSTDSNKKS